MAIDVGPVLFCLSTVPERFRIRSGTPAVWNSSGTVPERLRNGSGTVPERFQNGSRTVPERFRNGSETVSEQNYKGGGPPQLPTLEPSLLSPLVCPNLWAGEKGPLPNFFLRLKAWTGTPGDVCISAWHAASLHGVWLQHSTRRVYVSLKMRHPVSHQSFLTQKLWGTSPFRKLNF